MPEEITESRCRRKRDQCWELAGCARQDGDRADEKRYTDEARLWSRRLGAILRGEPMEE